MNEGLKIPERSKVRKTGAKFIFVPAKALNWRRSRRNERSEFKISFIRAPLHNLAFELLLKWKQKVRIFFSVFHAISKSLVANIFLLVEFFLAFSLGDLNSFVVQFEILVYELFFFLHAMKFMHIWVSATDFWKEAKENCAKSGMRNHVVVVEEFSYFHTFKVA